MHAAGVVADHTAERAAIMSGGIGRESEMVFFGSGAEMVEHNPWFHASDAADGIDFQNPRHVLGKIEDHCDVAALASEGCPSTAAEQWRAEIAAEGDRGENIVGIAGNYNANRNLAIVGAVGGVESASAAVEPDFTANFRMQRFRQPQSVDLRGLGGLREFCK
jgi:hypothetical protein